MDKDKLYCFLRDMFGVPWARDQVFLPLNFYIIV